MGCLHVWRQSANGHGEMKNLRIDPGDNERGIFGEAVAFVLALSSSLTHIAYKHVLHSGGIYVQTGENVSCVFVRQWRARVGR